MRRSGRRTIVEYELYWIQLQLGRFVIGYALTICRLLLPYYRSSKNVINRWNQRLDKHRLIVDVTRVIDCLLLTGLLIEADPSYYTQVLGKNRKAWSINACLSPYNSTSFVSDVSRYIMQKSRKWRHYLCPHYGTVDMLLEYKKYRCGSGYISFLHLYLTIDYC